MEDIMEDNFEKLNLLLEQEQCEFVDIPDGFTGQTESGELRLIYLMNDAVESFLVLKNPSPLSLQSPQTLLHNP